MPSLLIYYDILKNESSIINKVIHNTDDFKNYCIQLFNFISKKYLSSNINNNTKLTYQQNDDIFTINKENTIIRTGWIYNSSNIIITPIYEFKLMEINNEFTEYLNKQEETLNDLILLNNSLEKTIDYFFEKSPSLNYKNNKKLSFNFTEGLVENSLHEDTESNNSSNDPDLVRASPTPFGPGQAMIIQDPELNRPVLYKSEPELGQDSYKIDSISSISQDYLNKTHTIHQQYPISKNNVDVEYLLPPIDTESDESLESYINNYSLHCLNLNYSNPVCTSFYDNNKIYTLSQPQIYSPFIDKINYSLHGHCTTTTTKKNKIIPPPLNSLNNIPNSYTKKTAESTRIGVLSYTKQDVSFIDELKEKLHQKFKNT